MTQIQQQPLRLTDEQIEAVGAFGSGKNLAIEAGAGTGKTSTLKAMGESDRRKRSQYVAFNRAIVLDAGEKMPRNVKARTAHSIAKRAVGHRYEHRLGGARMRSYELGQLLGVDPLVVLRPNGPKVLQPGYLASLVMKAILNYCFTDDEIPTKRHVPYVDGIDGLGPDGKRLWDNNNAVRAHIESHLMQAWRDVCDPDGRLPFKHDHYLKIYERSNPHIPADSILFDEAQDAAPVMLSIVNQQQHAQRVYVGDSQQQIYSWRGAVNALGLVDVSTRTFLTQSFRFGPAIAAVANSVLDGLDAEIRLRGFDEIPSVVTRLEHPRAILTRTNAAAMRCVLHALADGTAVHLVGDGEEIERFARGALDLQTTGATNYGELACFGSWGEVLEYVEDDPSGEDLVLLVRLIEEYGAATILQAMRRASTEANAELVVSTAHKAKGREWESVQLEDDFREVSPMESPEEWRLLYVAVTRARRYLDVSQCTTLLKMG